MLFPKLISNFATEILQFNEIIIIMRRALLLTLLALLGLSQMAAQDDYTPFVREGVQWVCYFENYKDFDVMGFQPGRTFFTLEIKGDTVIDGKAYKAMHKYSGNAIDPDNDTVLVYLREENRIVYAIIPEGMASDSFLVGYGDIWDYNIYEEAKSGKEIILYEFNETESYYKYIFGRKQDELSYLGVDKVDVGGQQVNRHTFNYRVRSFYFIEGIGYDGFISGYPLSYLYTLGDYFYYLSHVVENGKTIYKSVNYRQPGPYDGRMPMAREGMQWVFERVTLDHGEATSQYYTYELRGMDPRGFPSSENYDPTFRKSILCRYYEGTKPNGSDGEIVVSLREMISSFEEPWFIDNTVMDKVAAEGRNLIRRVYLNDDHHVETPYMYCHTSPESGLQRYIGLQLPPKILTTDNFTLVEPVEIDGYSCNRYAYVDESGQVQCYIIEGIGIDSRDMGDLLAPLTRKPDPDADYQEFCGLSHVIMDGKIIYKGMRYNAEAVEGNPYDVDGDGQVNIADVTALIDMLLSPQMLMMQQADVDGNGELNIADVTFLIDHILSH